MEKPNVTLHIGVLIGKLIIVNVPFDSEKSSSSNLEHSIANLSQSVVSAVLKSLTDLDSAEEKPEINELNNTPQNELH